MSTIRARLCQEALTWEHTPYHHGAAVKGVGADCARFPLAVAQAVGLLPRTYQAPVYSPTWHLHQRRELYYEYLEAAGCLQVAWEDRQAGDVVLFRFALTASHAAILLPDNAIIHAVIDQGVIVSELRGSWLALHDRVYQLPGVTL